MSQYTNLIRTIHYCPGGAQALAYLHLPPSRARRLLASRRFARRAEVIQMLIDEIAPYRAALPKPAEALAPRQAAPSCPALNSGQGIPSMPTRHPRQTAVPPAVPAVPSRAAPFPTGRQEMTQLKGSQPVRGMRPQVNT